MFSLGDVLFGDLRMYSRLDYMDWGLWWLGG